MKVTKPLGELVEFMRNGTTAEQNQDGVGYPVTRIETISQGVVDSNRVRFVNLTGNELVKWKLQVGDILFSHINSEEHIGKSALYEGQPTDLVHGMNLLLLRPAQDQVLPSFLHYFLRSPQARSYVRARCKKAINQASINQKELGAMEAIAPPLAEQAKVVDLLTRAEGIVRLRREAAAKASELIPALFIHHFGDPATNPMGWPQCTLGDVVNIASGGTPSKARPDFWEGDLPWVSPKDMKRTVIVDAIDHISPKVVEKTNLKLVPKDAVLIVVRGMILAHTVPIAITARPVTINQDMKALTAKEGVRPAFLLWHLKVMHHELLGATSTAAHGTKKLETKDLLRQPVVVPPLALQGQFCEQMMAMESIQRQQIDALAKAQASFDALLAQAFAPA